MNTLPRMLFTVTLSVLLVLLSSVCALAEDCGPCETHVVGAFDEVPVNGPGCDCDTAAGWTSCSFTGKKYTRGSEIVYREDEENIIEMNNPLGTWAPVVKYVYYCECDEGMTHCEVVTLQLLIEDCKNCPEPEEENPNT